MARLKVAFEKHVWEQAFWKVCGRCGRVYSWAVPNSRGTGPLFNARDPVYQATETLCGPCVMLTAPQREAMRYAREHPEAVLQLAKNAEKQEA